ncbi:hypothetical protein POM88_045539 [Heracleum sosnowskyi]|uniref:Reverse transcriptase zinc-binding domain-containing protein n=1 Tax=Heracleum sosnowskyi TaxID=360622 RepID=A0AAD8M3X8_9APIA|nr:hypothetical protein POM88_045539 [Heracleum sosnowskyi]
MGYNVFLYLEKFRMGKDIILKGYRWRIGKGNNVRVLEDPWISRPRGFQIFEKPCLFPNLHVIDLKLGNGNWDEGFIRSNFSRDDALSILFLPCGESEIEDEILWHNSKNGDYNVKSGYKIALGINDTAEASDMRKTESWWSSLWKMKVPAKVKHIVWKVCHFWFPTNKYLCRKGVPVAPLCMRCWKGVEEDVFHSLWQCPASSKIWKLAGFKEQISECFDNNIICFLSRMKEKLFDENFNFCCYILADLGTEIGVAVWNEYGKVIVANISFLSVRYDVLAAETRAIQEGLYVAAFFNFTEFTIESDCQNALSLIFKKDGTCSDLDVLVYDIRNLVKHTTCVSDPREADMKLLM